MDGDNNLDGAAVQDFNEMAEVGSADSVNVIVLIDRKDKPASIYKVERGITLDKASPLIEKGEVNMGNPETLKEFVEYAVSNFPAEKVALIFWNHGDGWRSIGRNKRIFKAASYDEDDGNGTEDPLYMWEVVKALKDLKEKGISVNLIGFDECLMGMAEVAIDIANYAEDIVFSEITEPYDGWDYKKVLTSLTENPTQSPNSFAKSIVDSYYQAYGSYSGSYTLSAVESSQTELIKQAINDFASYYLSLNSKDSIKSEILNARDKSLEADDHYGSNDENTYVDIKSLFENIYNDTSDSTLKEKAANVLNALNIYTKSVGENYSGISIYFPKSSDSYEYEYGFEVPSYSYYYGNNYYNPASSQWKWNEFLEDLLN